MIQVVSAFIVRNGRILLQQRKGVREFPFCWESPGGKVEDRDVHSPVRALRRELDEEVGWRGPVGYLDAGTIEEEPFLVTAFSPPTTSKEITLQFHLVLPAPTWVPQLIDAEGLGWFAPGETAFLRLTPGNERLRDHIFSLRTPIPGFS